MSPPSSLSENQKSRFERLVAEVLASNPFYQAKYRPLGLDSERLPRFEELHRLPLTRKAELVEDQASHPPFGTDLTFALDRYSRLHVTSGTSGHPLRWLDDEESWDALVDCWHEAYRAAGVGRPDRVFVAFSFGPFLGFWTAFHAAQRSGALVIPGGTLTTVQRLASMLDIETTALVCTPTYALRLAETAQQRGLDLAASPIRVTLHGGEPGASVPNVRSRIESAFGASCFDHAGATEVGSWGYACDVGANLHVNERHFIAEVIDPETLEPVEPDADGIECGELVLTTLSRIGSPVIRYRTGDFVRLTRRPCSCGCGYVTLLGGVLSRVDDMLIVRGVNVYPSAIENLVRELPEIGEFEMLAAQEREMAELLLRIEVESGRPGVVAERLARRVRQAFSLRPTVETVEPGSLPRHEGKARRFKRRVR